MTTPLSYAFEVNWNGDGVTWTDETANVLKIRARRGRDYASALVGKAQAGELSATLQNPSQRYSEFNAGSPLYGNIIPGRKVRVRAITPVARTLWQGFLADPNPDAGGRGGIATAKFICNGPLWWIGEQESSTALEASIKTGAAVGKVLDDAGWPAGDRAIDTGQLTMLVWKADTERQDDIGVRKALIHLQELEEAEMGFLSESADGKIVFEDVHHRLIPPYTTSQATFSDASGAALPCTDVEQLSPWRFIYNRFVAEVTPVALRSSATLWSLSGETPVIAPGASYTVTAIYPPPGTTDTPVAVATWNTPTLIANAAADGSGLDLTSKIVIVTVKGANTLVITLTNTSTMTAYITRLFVTGTPYKKGDTGRVESKDAASITKYGKRTWPLGGKFYPTLQRAKDFCDWGLSRYKDPQPLLSFVIDPRMSDAHMTQALTRDVSDRITVRADGTTPSGAQLGVNADFFIESIDFEIDGAAGLVSTTYRVSYAGDATHGGEGAYWVLGKSTLGQTTRLVI